MIAFTFGVFVFAVHDLVSGCVHATVVEMGESMASDM